MIIYVEKDIQNDQKTKEILEKFPQANIVFIDNYKNIFSKKLPIGANKNSFILATLKTKSITQAPKFYGHNNKNSYFLKTSINCIFDCSYCFLKGAFKNDIPVYFLNYGEIKEEILLKIKNIKQESSIKNIENDFELKLKINKNYKNKTWFYSGDYSDILAMEYIAGFIKEFVGFFEKLENTMMEIRTKSCNIKPILDLGFIPKNTEFAFSLNPQELIEKYEHKTSSLEQRIKAINTLTEKGYKVGLRFLPLLPVENYQEIYTKFVDEIRKNIDMKKISSTFVSGLLYTKRDYSVMLKKYPKLDILYKLKQEKDGFVRENKQLRDFFYTLFKKLDKKCFICLDEN